MRFRQFLFCLAYASLIVFTIFYSLLTIFGLTWDMLWADQFRLAHLVFYYFFLSISLALLMQLMIWTLNVTIRFDVQRKLRKVLNHEAVKLDANDEMDRLLANVAGKLDVLTESLQKTENQTLLSQEEIIENERKRIARDLHDTVSQELFAASMILSGLEAMEGQLAPDQLSTQVSAVNSILDTAQKDLRILLLHLRPSELEDKSLVEGFQLILKEVSDKSQLAVDFKHQVGRLPRSIEDHVFRIAQEIISNTLKHAKAKLLAVYLMQHARELHLRMSDDGQGFEPEIQTDLSYGMKNIRDRVHDMAGTLKVQSAPGKGTTIDIRIPLVKGDKDE